MVREIADLHGLSRDVARAASALERAERSLARASDPESLGAFDPIEPWRHVAGQRTYEALGELTTSALDVPLRDGLRRWVYALTQARIGWDLVVEEATATAETSTRLDVTVPRLVSWRQAWRGVVTAESRPERRAWLDAAAARGPDVASLARRRGERRLEVARRLGLAHPVEMTTALPRAALTAAAHLLIARTDDLTRALLREAQSRDGLAGEHPSPTDAIALAVARDAPEGWPAHHVTRWLDETVGVIARGLRLDVSAPPEIVGASSFMRALGAFGYALRVAGSSPSLPFAVARDPFFTSAHRFARVCAALPSSAAFQRRALGNVARVADAQSRTLLRTTLLDARLAAARFLLTDEAAADRGGLFEDLSARLYGAPMPAALAGAWPSARADEPSRFLAVLGAPSLAHELEDRFDEDWFRNPRAAFHLRAIASAPARDATDPTDLDAAALALARSFEERLG